MFTTDAETLDNMTFETAKTYIKRHMAAMSRYNKLHDYYLGRHEILNRQKEKDVPNNKIVCNHAKEISDTATGYFIGNPISYSGKDADTVREWFDSTDIDKTDMFLAKKCSIYGVCYELVNMSNDDVPEPKSYGLDPRNTFVVYDDTVEHKPLFAVYYYPSYDENYNLKSYKVWLYTNDMRYMYVTDTRFESAELVKTEQNYFGKLQIIEYRNNDDAQGDFEQVIGLIDAYNLLMSDRVNDKEQFVDAILLLINAMLGDDEDEKSETKKILMQDKMLELPAESDARYLTRTFDESGVDILKKALEQDIHKFANVPCLSDENFAGNSSGVAMEYKLLGLEMITKIKERYFKEGIKKRIELYNAINRLRGGELAEAEPIFTRGLPKNVVELSGIVSQLSGLVPDEILLSLLPFIRDPKAAIEMLKQQREENMRAQMEEFGMQTNTLTGDGDEE